MASCTELSAEAPARGPQIETWCRCHQPGSTLGRQPHTVGPCLALVLMGTDRACRPMNFGTTVGIPAVFRGTSCLASWNGGGSVSVYVSFMRGSEGREKAGSSVQGKKQILHASFYLRNKNTPRPSISCLHPPDWQLFLLSIPLGYSSWGHRICQGLISL